MKQNIAMPNYFLHTEPDSKGNFRLHVEKCPHINNTKSISFLGEFKNLSNVISECKSSDHSISLCKECIDVNYTKSAIKNTTSFFNRLQNTISKKLCFVTRKKS